MAAATKTLPEEFAQCSEINLKKNKSMSITLNLISILIFILCFFLLSGFAALTRPEEMNAPISFTIDLSGALISLASLLFLSMMILVLHEMIHGVLFWRYTHSKPVFAIRLLYASASAPDWYFSSRQYAIIGAGPFLLISLIGIALILLAPTNWMIYIFVCTALNAAGSIGDLYVLWRLTKLPSTCLINDTGDSIYFFTRQSIPDPM